MRAEQSDRERAGGGKGGGWQRMSRVLGISVPVGVRATLRRPRDPQQGPESGFHEVQPRSADVFAGQKGRAGRKPTTRPACALRKLGAAGSDAVLPASPGRRASCDDHGAVRGPPGAPRPRGCERCPLRLTLCPPVCAHGEQTVPPAPGPQGPFSPRAGRGTASTERGLVASAPPPHAGPGPATPASREQDRPPRDGAWATGLALATQPCDAGRRLPRLPRWLWAGGPGVCGNKDPTFTQPSFRVRESSVTQAGTLAGP